MTVLFFDTETTGLPNKKADITDPSQPHIIQLAAILTDDNGHELSSLNLIVRPSDAEVHINSEVSAIHGITDDIVQKYGVRSITSMALFHDMMVCSGLIVAHNIKFDMALLRIAMARLNRPQWLVKRNQFCTMSAAAPIVNLPPTSRMREAGITSPKSPKLEECIQHFFGEKLEGAHDALVDVRACARLYWHLKKLGK